MCNGNESLTVSFTLNGSEQRVDIPASHTLLEMLRVDFGLMGTKRSCSEAVCGACTVLEDGLPIASCARFMFQVNGRAITTVEGLSDAEGMLHPVQLAFLKKGSFQCAFCTSGMIMLAKALLDSDPNPDRETITEWMSSNICRCTGYETIIEAVEEASRMMGNRSDG